MWGLGSARQERSPRELRHREALSLEGLHGPELEAAVGQSFWQSRRSIGGLLFATLLIVCPWALALDGWSWVFTGEPHIGDSASPPAARWSVTLLLTALSVVLTAGWLGAWRRLWIRLDSTGITHRTAWYFRQSPPTAYPWAQCGPFAVREVPVSDGRSAWLVECVHDTFTLGDDLFGDPRDLATILNVYRSAYLHTGDLATTPPGSSPHDHREDSSPTALRRHEAQRLRGLTGTALRNTLGDSTWTTESGVRYVELGLIAFCGIGFAVFAALVAVNGTETACTGGVLIGSAVLFTCTVAYVACAIRNPPWVRANATGISVGGARLLWPLAPPRCHRWDEYGPFALHVITGEVDRVVARCALDEGHLKLESGYGDPYDLVTILNAYRTVYRGNGSNRADANT